MLYLCYSDSYSGDEYFLYIYINNYEKLAVWDSTLAKIEKNDNDYNECMKNMLTSANEYADCKHFDD